MKEKKYLYYIIVLLLVGVLTTILVFALKDEKTLAKNKINANYNFSSENKTEEVTNKTPEENENKEVNTKNESKDQEVNKTPAKNETITKEENKTNNTTTDTKKEENKTDNSNNSNNSNNIIENAPSKEEIKEDSKEDVTPSEEETEVEVQVDVNDAQRKSIEQKYGVSIKYAAETANYKPMGLTPNILTDDIVISNILTKVDNVLGSYPSGFFKDFVNKGMPVTIYLIENIENNVFTGYFDREFYSDLKLTMTNTYFFERTFNHELMHYIDAYLEIVMYPNTPFTAWEALNPYDFVYGKGNLNYVYDIIERPTGIYFLEHYGQGSIREDRATIFEDMMTRVIPKDYYNAGEPIRAKADLLSSQIRTYFPSAAGGGYWDHLLK